ncbi:MAG: hexapeptide transferase [Bacteroidales bacterium]|nr:hexapeptide transferase [Bacteroidales bacterium]
MKSAPRQMLNSVIHTSARLTALKDYLFYRRHFRRLLKRLGMPTGACAGEQEHLRYWKQLSPHVEPYSYRLCSHVCHCRPHVIPEDIGHNAIEPVLNPPAYWPVYEDKNMFPRIVGADRVPRTVACRIGGGALLDDHFTPLPEVDLTHCADTLFLKPSVNTSCGDGVKKFVRRDGTHVGLDDGTPLTADYLMAYGDNFVLQEGVVQHPFYAQFNASSVNTLRLIVYRSVRDEQHRVSAGILRIGRRNAPLDNTMTGGCYVGIDIRQGVLGHFAVDRNSRILDQWNDIDLSRTTFQLPLWNETVRFACEVCSHIAHHRLIALDIALTAQGQPTLIEYNIGGFNFWTYNILQQDIFAGETDDVVQFCKNRLAR